MARELTEPTTDNSYDRDAHDHEHDDEEQHDVPARCSRSRLGGPGFPSRATVFLDRFVDVVVLAHSVILARTRDGPSTFRCSCGYRADGAGQPKSGVERVHGPNAA
jgi:hypothetical protein